MTRIGIVGFGLMGRTHLNACLRDDRTEIGAIVDPDSSKLDPGKIESNFGGDQTDFDLSAVTHYRDFDDLVLDDDIDAVIVCSPTAHHVEMTIRSLEAGKHVLCEKPLALTSAEAMRAVEAAARFPDLIAMPAMCMRFWPAWRWLKEVVDDGRYGGVRSATFTRLGAMPDWAAFYRDATASGGAILDLHIHDADFVRYCFGDPQSVFATGSSEVTEGIDHVIAHYHYESGPKIVCAEGGWTQPGSDFHMRYIVNFDDATARFEFGAEPELRIARNDGREEHIELSALAGYDHELSYFLDCIERGEQPTIVTMRDGAEAVRLIEKERQSVLSGEVVPFTPTAARTTLL